jgi:hypothetical protein
MSRLFITPREIQFINDTTKEFVKDVIGHSIMYYAVSTMKTDIHDVYDEAMTKIFENPVKLDVIAGQPSWETRHNIFGAEQTNKIEIFVQARDLIDKSLTLNEGDFFTYHDGVYEVSSYLGTGNIFGLEEYDTAYKIVGVLARPGAFDPKTFFPPQKDSAGPYEQTEVLKTFEQQRGLPENSEGPTGDIRQANSRLENEMAPIALGEGPRKVDETADKKTSSFVYDEDIK